MDLETKTMEVEKQAAAVERKLDPPERDLMVRDVFRFQTKLIVGLLVALMLSFTATVGVAVYFSNQLDKVDARYMDFFNSFEFEIDGGDVSQSTEGGGNANFSAIGDNNVFGG